jgi:CheY-like chemotaxis protein
MSDYPVVLYLEDDPSSREVMEFLLVYDLELSHVTIWKDSTDFITKLEALFPRPDVVFLDIHMRPHSGFEMLEMLRQRDDYRKIPVIAITASVMNEEVQKLREAGFNGAIAKPIDQLAFPTILKRILNGEEVWRIISAD